MTHLAASFGKPVVVVVEDEEAIRPFVCETLSEAGFEIVEARHADDAIAVLHKRANEIHAIFTDIRMPGSMDGLALAHLTRRRWPWIALLIASGEARPAVAALPSASRFLAKPYHPDDVVNHLLEMLALHRHDVANPNERMDPRARHHRDRRSSSCACS